jgi:hypothetical protein
MPWSALNWSTAASRSDASLSQRTYKSFILLACLDGI